MLPRAFGNTQGTELFMDKNAPALPDARLVASIVYGNTKRAPSEVCKATSRERARKACLESYCDRAESHRLLAA